AEAAAPVAAETAPAPAAAPAPTGMTPEQIQALIDQALNQQKKQLEAGLKAQSDEQLKALQSQLAEAQRMRSAPPAPVQPTAARIESLADESATSRSQQAAQAPVPQAAAPAPQPAAPKPEERPAPATTTPTQPTPAQSAPAQQSPAPAAKTPESGGVRQGDLIKPGVGVVPPRVVRKPGLAYPALAKRMKREATVTVRVLVDENGRPSEVQAAGDKAGFGLDEAAVEYARGCLFEPAKKNGIKVKMWYDLKVSFTLGGG
ncbi:MAG TPA: energy transducer TonB, partial [Thermoanaerobaculia bacterium]|nr:energy transducer TonB [Thermoanaerobaculia bacterium]